MESKMKNEHSVTDPQPESETFKGLEKSAGSQEEEHANITDYLPKTPDAIKKEKHRIWKNIIMLGIAFMFTFTAYNGLGRMQSSIHRTPGMGTVNQSVTYAVMLVSSIFVPKLLLSAIGHKWTIAVSQSGYILWMAANGYAVWGTMVTTSILVGLCAAPLWTAQGAYIALLGMRYAKLTGEKTSNVMSTFFGVFNVFFQLSSVIGSVISYTILKPPEDATNNTLSDEEISEFCGASDCPDSNITNPNLEPPDTRTMWILVGTYCASGVLALVIVCTALDQLPRQISTQVHKTTSRKQAAQSVVATLMHMRYKPQLLLIPLTIYLGLENGFQSSDWNKSYVGCALGIHIVGLVSLVFGAVNGVSGVAAGYIAKYTGRIAVLSVGLFGDMAFEFFLLFWKIDADKPYVFYIIASVWGMTDGIRQAMAKAFYGELFPDETEAAFSNFQLWVAVGSVVAFAYSSYICTYIKLIVLMCVLFVGIVMYYVAEGLERNKKSHIIETDISMKPGSQSAKSMICDDSSIIGDAVYKSFQTQEPDAEAVNGIKKYDLSLDNDSHLGVSNQTFDDISISHNTQL